MDDQPNPGAAPLNELSDSLRQAVEHVRTTPVPADALARALENAEKLASTAPPIRRQQRRWPLYTLATAAGMLLAVGVWQFFPERRDQRAARLDEVPAKVFDNSSASAGEVRSTAPAKRVDAEPSTVEKKSTADAPTSNNVRKTEAGKAAPPPTAPTATAAPRAMRRMARAMRVLPGTGAPSPGSPVVTAPMPAPGPTVGSPASVAAGTSISGASGNSAAVRGRAPLPAMGARMPSPSATKNDRPTPDAVAKDGDFTGKGDTSSVNDKKGPAVARDRLWRNDGRPGFARVYVGDGNALELVSLDVKVSVEGPRARTIVDHVFRNPHPRQLEGTFEYPLPSGASPSYFAMFLGQSRDAIPPRFARAAATAEPLSAGALANWSPEQLVRKVDRADWGRLQEARVVAKEKALEAYEEIVRGRVDPALLEYASGNTFRGRVFPIPPRGYNRVILAYEELLPLTGDKMVYRFPLPEQKLSSLHLSLQARPLESRDRAFVPGSATSREAAGHVYYTREWKDEQPKEPDVLFTCTPATPDVQAISGRLAENGPNYTYVRVRPELKKIAGDAAASPNAVFLLDTSLSESGARFDVSMKLLRAILERDAAIKQFNVVAFNAAATWVEPKGWISNTKEARAALFRQFDGLLLEGATDVGAALDCLAKPPSGLPGKAAVDCFLLSDGQATWGETDATALVARFEARCPFVPRFHCYQTGLSAENTELFQALTRRGGGVFNCRGDNDIALAAVAHRHQCLQVESVRFVGGPAAADVVVAGRKAAVYPDGELVVAGRFQGTGHTNLVVEGNFAGKRFAQEFPIDVRDGSELAPRGWGEIVVTSLQSLNDPKLDPLVTAYCQQFNIGSSVASFLVLENDADYKRLNLEVERGKTASGDLGAFLERSWNSLAEAVSPRQMVVRFLERIESRPNMLTGNARARVHKLIALMTDKDFELPAATLTGALSRKADVPPEYLAARGADRFDAKLYIAEAQRRARANDVDGAVRALSGIIEEYPARGDALRLVGYRLLDLKQPARAAQLFERVRRQRPFEPHSYRDLARALEQTGNFALAALQYEIVLGSNWHNRFGQSVQLVSQEEYCRMMQEAIHRKAVNRGVADFFGERVEVMPEPHPEADLRATISWNTDATDVDLWVIEPDGTKCFYQHNHTKNGGELSQDRTQGYGPERYQVKKALKGKYRILVHYFNDNPNLLAGETHVNVVVMRFAGTDREVVQRYTVILHKKGEEAEVCEVEF